MNIYLLNNLNERKEKKMEIKKIRRKHAYECEGGVFVVKFDFVVFLTDFSSNMFLVMAQCSRIGLTAIRSAGKG